MLRSGQPLDVQVSAMGRTLLLEASGALGVSETERLREHIDRARHGDRRVVLDLTAVERFERESLEMLRDQWRAVGDRLRVVAPTDSAAAAAMKRAGLRRFAVHATLSGALAQAAE